MSDFEILKREADSRGWTYKPSAGDHFKFYPPEPTKGMVVVSMNVNSTARAFKNSIMEFRKYDREFMKRKYVKKKSSVPEAEGSLFEEPKQPERTEQNTTQSMKPTDKTIYKQYAWLQIGTKVKDRNNDRQHSALVVTEIHSADGKRVWDESDIVIVKGDGPTEHLAGDLDAWETRKCRCCGEYRPANWFNLAAKSESKRTICRECLAKEDQAQTVPALRTIEDILEDLERLSEDDAKERSRLIDEMLTLLRSSEKNIIAGLTPEQIRDILWNMVRDEDYKRLVRGMVEINPKFVLNLIDKTTMVSYLLLNLPEDSTFRTDLYAVMMAMAKTMTDPNPLEQHQLLSMVSNEVLMEAVSMRKLQTPPQPLTDTQLLNEAGRRGLAVEMTTEGLTDKQLYDALKKRGWNIGKLERTVVETLE